jgi:hypothetical protein
MSSTLKEIKVPTYKKGKKYDYYIIGLMHAAGTRGKMKEVLMGSYMELMPRYTINQQGERVRGELSAEHVEMSKENQRALAELAQAMPSGRLIRIVKKAKSDAFPEGCVYTALQHLKKQIGRVSAGNESELKKTFESEEVLAKM